MIRLGSLVLKLHLTLVPGPVSAGVGWTSLLSLLLASPRLLRHRCLEPNKREYTLLYLFW